MMPSHLTHTHTHLLIHTRSIKAYSTYTNHTITQTHTHAHSLLPRNHTHLLADLHLFGYFGAYECAFAAVRALRSKRSLKKQMSGVMNEIVPRSDKIFQSKIV